MNTDSPPKTNTEKPTRRKFLTAIGMVGGTAALYQAMTTMGHAAETQFNGPPDLSGARGRFGAGAGRGPCRHGGGL